MGLDDSRFIALALMRPDDGHTSAAKMSLCETFSAISPSVVGFISKGRMSPDRTRPLFSLVFGTGFFVHKDGIVATNRHVVETFASVPPHPKTGKTEVAALMFYQTQSQTGEAGQRMIVIDLKGSTAVNSFKIH